jgi:hypothetical protein
MSLRTTAAALPREMKLRAMVVATTSWQVTLRESVDELIGLNVGQAIGVCGLSGRQHGS